LPVDITRTISGRGSILIPEDANKARNLFLYTQIKRKPRTPYFNRDYNPPQTFYANVQFCLDDFVLQTLKVQYDNQMFDIWTSQPSQNLLSLICAVDGLYFLLSSVGGVLGLALPEESPIKAHGIETYRPNRLRFSCFAESALVITLKSVDLDRCEPEDGTPSPPPPPPPPVEEVPPDEPVEVSPPEEGEEPGDTDPFPGDPTEPEGPDLPSGEECEALEIVFRVFGIPTAPPEGQELQVAVWGVIESIAIVADPILPPPAQVCNVVCGGLISVACEQGQTVALAGGNSTEGFSVDILEIRPWVS
jgi:hypothetical protein